MFSVHSDKLCLCDHMSHLCSVVYSGQWLVWVSGDDDDDELLAARGVCRARRRSRCLSVGSAA